LLEIPRMQGDCEGCSTSNGDTKNRTKVCREARTVILVPFTLC